MKNLKLFMLSALVMSVVILTSCGGDESEKKGVTFDGENLNLSWVGIDMGDYADGNLEVVFTLDEPVDINNPDSDVPHFMIQIGAEWEGTKVDLTEIDDQFDWSWYVELETEDDYLDGFGCCEEEFNDVTGGSFKITELDADTHTFEIDATVEFGDRKLKAYYKGELVPYNEVSVLARTNKRGNN